MSGLQWRWMRRTEGKKRGRHRQDITQPAITESSSIKKSTERKKNRNDTQGNPDTNSRLSASHRRLLPQLALLLAAHPKLPANLQLLLLRMRLPLQYRTRRRQQQLNLLFSSAAARIVHAAHAATGKTQGARRWQKTATAAAPSNTPTETHSNTNSYYCCYCCC